MNDKQKLTSFDDAMAIVLSHARKHVIVEVDLLDSTGMVLAEEVLADRDFPPFDRVTMDGIAINHTFYQKDKKYPIEGLAPAGQPISTLVDDHKCIEVMTGAVLPRNTDTIIRYEDVETIEGICRITTSIRQGQNVHLQGSDCGQSTVLLNIGHKIKAIDINVMASVGKSTVKVYQMPIVAVVSSGDELVEVSEIPKAHQIRRSNAHMIAARLRELGVSFNMFHLTDNKLVIENSLKSIVGDHDAVILSGGVSKGKFDFIPDALEAIGVQKQFHRVAQRPGKPFWFGAKDAVKVFAFPGNPVSTLACFHAYFMPWLSKSIHKNEPRISVILSNDFTFTPQLTYFAQANLKIESGALKAEVAHGSGSGNMLHPTKMDGFVILPSNRTEFYKGEVYQFLPFHPIV